MPKRKIFIALGAVGLLLVSIAVEGMQLFAASVSAQAVFPPGMETTIAEFVGKIILFINVGIWILFTFLQFLLDPLFIFGIGGNLMTVLNQIWVLARNLMNIIFTFMLIGAAIYTIFTAKKEFLHQYGAKFIMAVILVNFSWFFPRVILDVANVGAAAVYGIPSLLSSSTTATCRTQRTVTAGGTLPTGCNLVTGSTTLASCPCTGVTDVQFFVTEARKFQLVATGYSCPLGRVLCFKEQTLDFSTVAPFSGVLNGLVVNHARLALLARVPTPPASAPGGDVSAMISFLVREVVILVIHIALFFPLLAMTVAFFMRIPVLWITIAFMPFYFLDFLMGGAGEQFTQGYSKKILSTFIKAAFLPMIVGVPLSIGLMLLNAGSQLTGGEIASLPIPLFDGVNNFWQFLWLCMSMGVLWVGVFAVLKGDDILSTGAQSIKGYGESLGRLAIKAPLAIPTVPGTDGKMSFLGLSRALNPRNLEGALSGGQPLNKEFFTKQLGMSAPSAEAQKAAKALNGNDANAKKELAELQNLVTSANSNNTSLNRIVEILNARGLTVSGDRSNVGVRIEQLQSAGVKLGLSTTQIDAIQKFASSAAGGGKKKAEEEAKKKAP